MGVFDFETYDPDDLPGVVYTDHFYEPLVYTHQGIVDNAPPMAYPSAQWNKATLREYLIERMVNFARKNHVHFYFGELGAVRWAEGAGEYIRDVTELMEEFGFDWSFFAYSLGGDHLTIFGCTHTGPQGQGVYVGRNDQAWSLLRWFKLNQH
jgi:hypothetical protein